MSIFFQGFGMGTYVLHRPYQTCIFTGAGHSFAVRLILKISKNLEYAYVYNGSFTVTNHGLPLRMHGARTYVRSSPEKLPRVCVLAQTLAVAACTGHDTLLSASLPPLRPIGTRARSAWTVYVRSVEASRHQAAAKGKHTS